MSQAPLDGRAGRPAAAALGSDGGSEAAPTAVSLARHVPPDTNVFYHIEGSRQALKVVLYLDSYHFSKLPSRLESGASLRLHTVLFTKGELRSRAVGAPQGNGCACWEPSACLAHLLPSQLWRMWRSRLLQAARLWKICSRRSTPSLWRRFSSITANSGACVGLMLGPGSWTLSSGGGLCVEGTREPPVPGRAKCRFLSTCCVSVPLPTRAPQILTEVTFLTHFTDEGN